MQGSAGLPGAAGSVCSHSRALEVTLQRAWGSLIRDLSARGQSIRKESIRKPSINGSTAPYTQDVRHVLNLRKKLKSSRGQNFFVFVFLF